MRSPVSQGLRAGEARDDGGADDNDGDDKDNEGKQDEADEGTGHKLAGPLLRLR